MGLMDKQTQQAFALGGLNDEGGEIDEASGNRVPIGGTKEGVRDDIEINISEGEFVFPADVVRYHGLDKMMALRQEAKMGLKQMERMGQMGNSDEATMPDDLPFEMADLIVVGGKGEPMKFANGGFVPEMQTLETAPVPTMGGGTSTGTQTPIVYDDFMKTPVVTMQEYRDANGNSIIITSVNGKATTEIPAGYTLYVPPTNAAPTATQAAIQTANNYSYQTSGGGDEGPDTPRELQVDPDYASMDNDTYFSTMERQNSFGGKAGNAAAMGIALAMGPLGLLTMGMLQADKRRQLAAAEQRIAAETNPTKKKAYQATFAKMGGKTKEPEEENALVKFGKGFVAAVGGMFGLGNNDVEKVASVAGSAAADNTNAPAVEQAPAAAVDAGRVPAFKRGAEAFAKGQPVTSERIPAGNTQEFFDSLINNENITRKAKGSPLIDESAFFTAEPSPMPQRAGPTGTSETATSAEPLLTTKDKVVQKTPPSSFQIIPPTQSLYTGVKEQKTVVPDISESASRPAPVPNDGTFPVTSQVASLSPESIQTNTQPVAQTDMQMGIDPKNIYPTEEQMNLRGNVYNTNAQYRQMMGDANDPRYLAERMSEVFVPDTLSQLRGSYKNMPSLLGEKYPISTTVAREAAQRGTFQPDYTTGAQTDAALGPQTDMQMGIDPKNIILENYKDKSNLKKYYQNAGYSEAEARQIVDSVPVPNYYTNSPSTLGPDYPISTGKAYQASFLDGKSRFSEPAYTTGAQTDALLRPQTDAGALDDMIAGAPVRTSAFETGQPAVQVAKGQRTDRVKDGSFGQIFDSITGQRSVEELRDQGKINAQAILEKQALKESPDMFGPVAQPPAVIRQEPPTVLPDPAIQQTTVPRNLNQLESFPPQLVPTGEPYNPTDSLGADPMPDPRETVNPDPMNEAARVSNISTGTGSQLTLGQARNVEPRDMYGRNLVDQTSTAFNLSPSNLASQYASYGLGKSGQTGTPFSIDPYTSPISTPISTMTPEEASRMSVKEFNKQSAKAKAKQSDAARTSKGTSTRKAAPTGDDRRSDPNFLERTFGIEPAKISARRGNDGILYRTQADKREADKRQEDAKVSARNQGRAAARASGGQAAVDKFNKENADDIEKRHGGNKENSNNKIVCSAMNNAYGFGSFRNKIWLEHSKNNLTKEHQVGYHRMFLPLIHLGYNKDYKFIRKCLEHIARHRTADIYFQSKSNKRDTLGMVYRTILEPICYLVGMFPTSKDNK